MKNLLIILLLIGFFSCKNTSTKTVENTKNDTVTTKTDGVAVVDQVPIPPKKTIAKDTIRNYKDTQISEEFFQKAIVDLQDSTLTVYQNIRADYRIFGYQKPDTNSRKMIFFSVFTPDVEGNPYQCPYGSYYYSGAMQNTKIKYVKKTGAFVEAHLIKDNQLLPNPIYFLKNWVEFEAKN